jgi:enamine deaminase RidA (YjgF/YER057c/UK114 family)
MTTTRHAINPVPWSVGLGFDQAELIEGHRRQLLCSGQDAVDAAGTPQHSGDMAAQLTMALDNVEATLEAAGMTLAHVARLNVFTTDFDEMIQHWAVLADRMRDADAHFATSLLGVAQLPSPQLLVLLEATAFD